MLYIQLWCFQNGVFLISRNQEDVDPEYNPTNEEVEEYAKWLGMDLPKDKDLLWIAREGLKSPLPENWKPCKTVDTVRFCIFNNTLTCTSATLSPVASRKAKHTPVLNYVHMASLFSYFRRRFIISTLKQERVRGIILVMLIIGRFLKITKARRKLNDDTFPHFLV